MSAPKFCVLLLVLVQMATAVSQVMALDSRSEADMAISDAEKVMASAYQNVSKAEISGADISGVSRLLEDAAELLAQAHNSFRVGDFDSAVLFANLASEIGKEVGVSSVKSGERWTQMWLTIVGSLFANLVVVLTSYLGWRVFRRLYYRRISAKKPGVPSNEP